MLLSKMTKLENPRSIHGYSLIHGPCIPVRETKYRIKEMKKKNATKFKE